MIRDAHRQLIKNIIDFIVIIIAMFQCRNCSREFTTTKNPSLKGETMIMNECVLCQHDRMCKKEQEKKEREKELRFEKSKQKYALRRSEIEQAEMKLLMHAQITKKLEEVEIDKQKELKDAEIQCAKILGKDNFEKARVENVMQESSQKSKYAEMLHANIDEGIVKIVDISKDQERMIAENVRMTEEANAKDRKEEEIVLSQNRREMFFLKARQRNIMMKKLNDAEDRAIDPEVKMKWLELMDALAANKH